LEAVLNIRKPIGWTSFDVIRWLKRKLPGVKIGHAGTLDPFAEGVLLLCLGRATRQVQKLMDYEKEYVAVIGLGILTDTLDVTGRIIEEKPVPRLDNDMIARACKEFEGEIEQIPPSFSALKINGRRAYKLARSGQNVDLKARTVRIQSIDPEEFVEANIRLRVVCSKGTYIRSLARDIAEALGTVGFLRKLVRTKIGPYTVDQALSIDRLNNDFWQRFAQDNN